MTLTFELAAFTVREGGESEERLALRYLDDP